jgi:hypothetical protein
MVFHRRLSFRKPDGTELQLDRMLITPRIDDWGEGQINRRSCWEGHDTLRLLKGYHFASDPILGDTKAGMLALSPQGADG